LKVISQKKIRFCLGTQPKIEAVWQHWFSSFF